MESILVIALLVLLVVFIIFLVLREAMCWYWKINRIVFLLESINEILARSKDIIPGTELCPHCKKPKQKSENICKYCGKWTN